MPERVAVMQDFLGVRREVGTVSISGEAAIEFVVSGENVLDLGTKFRFLKRESVEQDGGIRDAVGSALQFRQGAAGAGGGFEHTRSLQFCLGWQIGKLVKGLVRVERHAV